MKNLISLIITGFILSNQLVAQGLELMKDPIGRPIQASKLTLEGDPYIFKDWKAGIIVQKSEKMIRVPKLNINGLYNRLEYETSGRYFFIEPDMFNTVIFLSGNDSIKIQKGFSQKGLNPSKLYQILYQGEFVWLKYHSKDIVNDQTSSYASEAKKTIKDDYSFYLIKGDEAFFLKNSKASLKKVFKEYKSIIQILDNLPLNLNDEESVLNFIKRVEAEVN